MFNRPCSRKEKFFFFEDGAHKAGVNGCSTLTKVSVNKNHTFCWLLMNIGTGR